MITDSKILVTGAAGFIGFHLSRRLAKEAGNQLVLVDNLARGQLDASMQELIQGDNVEFLQIDPALECEKLPEVDYVFHLASINGTKNFYERPYDVTRAAIAPTLALIDRYRNSVELRGFLLTSTSEVYAGAVEMGLTNVPTGESTPVAIQSQSNMRWSYAAGKIAAEQAVLGAFAQFEFPGSVLRYHNVYGPRMGSDHVIPQLMERFENGDYRVLGSENTRSFVYVDDAVEGTVAILESPKSLGRVTHLGTEHEVPIYELAALILEELGIQGELIPEIAPKGSVNRRCPDTTFLREQIGFAPKVDLITGLHLTALARA